jgi:hypothetical protein
VTSREEDSVQRSVKAGRAVAGTLVLLAGCGSSSSSSTNQTATFEAAYKAAVDPLEQLPEEIGTTVQGATSKTDAQLGAAFRQFASRWQTRPTQLASLKPPANVASAFSTVNAAATRVESDLKAIVAAAAARSSSAAQQAAQSSGHRHLGRQVGQHDDLERARDPVARRGADRCSPPTAFPGRDGQASAFAAASSTPSGVRPRDNRQYEHRQGRRFSITQRRRQARPFAPAQFRDGANLHRFSASASFFVMEVGTMEGESRMYGFSRAIYRELADEIIEDPQGAGLL